MHILLYSYSFTEPANIPSTRYFCANIYINTIGTVAITNPAIITGIFNVKRPLNKVIPTIKVRKFFFLKKNKRNQQLVPYPYKFTSDEVISAGTLSGIIIFINAFRLLHPSISAASNKESGTVFMKFLIKYIVIGNIIPIYINITETRVFTRPQYFNNPELRYNHNYRRNRHQRNDHVRITLFSL